MQKGFGAVNLHGTASGVIAVPVIGENGNWWIGNEDTGIAAQGEQGEQGVPGPQGLKGDKGNKGETGSQGLQGIQGNTGAIGAQGSKGEEGEAGPQGLRGDKGETGIQGHEGPVGSQGERGLTGIQGNIGPMGPQGLQGPKGTDADRGDIKRLDEAVEELNSDLVNIGKKYTTGSLTCQIPVSAFEVLAASLEVPAGTYIFIANIQWWSAKDIVLYSGLHTDGDSSTDRRLSAQVGATNVNLSAIKTFSSAGQENVYLNHTDIQSRAANVSITAIRIA